MPRATNNGGPREEGVGASATADQALAVPVEPVARLDPAGFDPSREETQEQRARRLFDEMARNIGREAVNHLKTMYPHTLLMAMIAMHREWEEERTGA